MTFLKQLVVWLPNGGKKFIHSGVFLFGAICYIGNIRQSILNYSEGERNMKRAFLFVLVALSLVLSACGSAPASEYPQQAIEIIAPANPGGGWDTLARTIQLSLETEKFVSQPLSVTNKPGGGGGVGLAYMAAQKGNDYTLVVYSPPLVINAINGTFEGKSYKDLTPIAKLITDYQIIVVKADSPYQTLEDLLNAMRADPKAIKFAGVSSPGSMDHVAFAKIAKAAGIDPKQLEYIAFAGGGEATTALLGGNVTFLSTGIGESVAQLEGAPSAPLAITAPERLPSDRQGMSTGELGYDDL
jgi:putative tricarboxylic transport membrane protein